MAVRRVLSAEKIKPHLSEYWLNNTDPDFEAKQAEIIILYLNLPKNDTIIIINKKTDMQTLSRKYQNNPAKKGSKENPSN